MDAKVAEMSDVAEINPDLTTANLDDNAIRAQAEIVKAKFEAKLSPVDIAIKKNLAEIAIIDSQIEDLNGKFDPELSDLDRAKINAKIKKFQTKKAQIVEILSNLKIKIAEIKVEQENALNALDNYSPNPKKFAKIGDSESMYRDDSESTIRDDSESMNRDDSESMYDSSDYESESTESESPLHIMRGWFSWFPWKNKNTDEVSSDLSEEENSSMKRVIDSDSEFTEGDDEFEVDGEGDTVSAIDEMKHKYYDETTTKEGETTTEEEEDENYVKKSKQTDEHKQDQKKYKERYVKTKNTKKYDDIDQVETQQQDEENESEKTEYKEKMQKFKERIMKKKESYEEMNAKENKEEEPGKYKTNVNELKEETEKIQTNAKETQEETEKYKMNAKETKEKTEKYNMNAKEMKEEGKYKIKEAEEEYKEEEGEVQSEPFYSDEEEAFYAESSDLSDEYSSDYLSDSTAPYPEEQYPYLIGDPFMRYICWVLILGGLMYCVYSMIPDNMFMPQAATKQTTVTHMQLRTQPAGAAQIQTLGLPYYTTQARAPTFLSQARRAPAPAALNKSQPIPRNCVVFVMRPGEQEQVQQEQ
eukprot:33560_1